MAIVESMFDLIQAEGHFPRQHIQENFSGSDVDLDRWHTGTAGGTGTFEMVDTIGEGFRVAITGTGGDFGFLSFNDVNQYGFKSGVFLAVWRDVIIANGDERVGFISVDSEEGGTNSGAYSRSLSPSDVFTLLTHGGSSSITDSNVARDTIFHQHRIELFDGSCELRIDDVLQLTKTDNLPVANMQPRVANRAGNGAAGDIHIRFLEAFNK